MKDFSYITNSHPAFIENLYQEFLISPESVDPDLKKFFEGFDFAVSNGVSNGAVVTTASSAEVDWMKEIKVYRLILGYRNKGHLLAKTNPIRERKDRGANLDLSFFGLGESDMNTVYQAGNLIGLGPATLKQILTHLENTYANHVGIEFKYISDQKKIDWQHKGYPFYTVGQRKGLDIALGKPAYVTAIDPDNNTVVLGDESDLEQNDMLVGKLNWIKYDGITDGMEAITKIRYKDKGALSNLYTHENSIRAHFYENVKGIAPGQSAVFYEGNDVIGGGIIQRGELVL